MVKEQIHHHFIDSLKLNTTTDDLLKAIFPQLEFLFNYNNHSYEHLYWKNLDGKMRVLYYLDKKEVHARINEYLYAPEKTHRPYEFTKSKLHAFKEDILKFNQLMIENMRERRDEKKKQFSY